MGFTHSKLTLKDQTKQMSRELDTTIGIVCFDLSIGHMFETKYEIDEFINKFIDNSNGEILEIYPYEWTANGMRFRLQKNILVRLRIQKQGKYEMYDQNVFRIIDQFLGIMRRF